MSRSHAIAGGLLSCSRKIFSKNILRCRANHRHIVIVARVQKARAGKSAAGFFASPILKQLLDSSSTTLVPPYF
jgi:hypothetical protein